MQDDNIKLTFMVQTNKRTLPLLRFWLILTIILIVASACCCNAQTAIVAGKLVDKDCKIAPESVHFTAHITKKNSDGTKLEIDTLTGYRKYYYANGALQMEGKVTKSSPKDYRDGIWNYYGETGLLMNQITSTKDGKIKELNFRYYKDWTLFTKTFSYYEGDYKNKATFKFHKIETLFYTNGQELSERHIINGKIVDVKCYNSKGKQMPLEYLKTIKSFDAPK